MKPVCCELCECYAMTHMLCNLHNVYIMLVKNVTLINMGSVSVCPPWVDFKLYKLSLFKLYHLTFSTVKGCFGTVFFF